MGHWLYILKSESADKYYVGETRDIDQRLEFHNNSGRGFTARYRPWTVIYKYECDSRETALELEKKIKNWKSKKMVKL